MDVLNKIVDFPATVNSKLPGINWKSSVEQSESSLNGWVGQLLQILSVVFVIVSLVTIGDGAIDFLDGADAQEMIGGILTALIFIYAAFPISQLIRSTGDKLSSSTNSIIPFLFKDVLEAGLKLLGYSAALIALASAAAGLVSFIVDTDVFAYGYQGLNSMGPDSMEMGLSGLAGFIEMGGLGDWLTDMLSVQTHNGTIGLAGGWADPGGAAMGLVSMILAPLQILISLFLTLAVYHFVYGLVSKLLGWISNPSVPIKMV